MIAEATGKVTGLFKKKYGSNPDVCRKLPQSGSYRQYFRLIHESKSHIGVYNKDIAENKAFLSFTRSFLSIKLPVPEIIAVSDLGDAYLIEDLGDITLFDELKTNRNDEKMVDTYKKIIDQLIRFQFEGFNVVDFTVCYPRSLFDAQSVRWDLNYFKYDFLKFLKISFDEQNLENDFNSIISKIEKIPSEAFLYRDFQSSNIMIKDNKLFFIDYQGGRRGSFYYDLASLLFDAKANLDNKTREIIADYYYEKVKEHIDIEKNIFKEEYTLFVLVRILQALGAYGFRGIFERKEQFIKSIPYAVANLTYISKNYQFPVEIPELMKVFKQLSEHPDCQFRLPNEERLTVHINSFSYKNGIPIDNNGNGGGFVFDCRGLPNPGRYPQYSNVTGKDQAVIDFFKDKKEVGSFLNHVYSLVDLTINDYITRKRTNLMINFGCTGGQHRSVYSAERLAEYLKKYDVFIVLKHLEQESV